MNINFTVKGHAVPAVRMTQKSKYVNKYAKRYLEFKKYVGWVAKQHMKQEPITGDCGIDITFYIHGNRADLDNLYKAVTDSCNKIIYKDDRQIKKTETKIITCDKSQERIEIEVYELDYAKS